MSSDKSVTYVSGCTRGIFEAGALRTSAYVFPLIFSHFIQEFDGEQDGFAYYFLKALCADNLSIVSVLLW